MVGLASVAPVVVSLKVTEAAVERAETKPETVAVSVALAYWTSVEGAEVKAMDVGCSVTVTEAGWRVDETAKVVSPE
jgi:hypothetical protein